MEKLFSPLPLFLCFNSCALFPQIRLLKEMGWQEYPENDENYLPLTEDELKEFQIKSEQVCFKLLLLVTVLHSFPSYTSPVV